MQGTGAGPGSAKGGPGGIGALDASGNLLIDGAVASPIAHDGDVTVGPNGRVSGTIEARHITVSGVVEADLHGRESIRVTATGRVSGDLHAPRIAVDTGALLRGRLVMRQLAEPGPEIDDAEVAQLLTGAPARR